MWTEAEPRIKAQGSGSTNTVGIGKSGWNIDMCTRRPCCSVSWESREFHQNCLIKTVFFDLLPRHYSRFFLRPSHIETFSGSISARASACERIAGARTLPLPMISIIWVIGQRDDQQKHQKPIRPHFVISPYFTDLFSSNLNQGCQPPRMPRYMYIRRLLPWQLWWPSMPYKRGTWDAKRLRQRRKWNVHPTPTNLAAK